MGAWWFSLVGFMRHHLFPFSSPGKESVTNDGTLSFLAKKRNEEIYGHHRENVLPHAARCVQTDK